MKKLIIKRNGKLYTWGSDWKFVDKDPTMGVIKGGYQIITPKPPPNPVKLKIWGTKI